MFRPPSVVLRRELAYLRKRLKAERAEALVWEGRLLEERSEGLAKLLDAVLGDVARTEALVGEYRRVIRFAEKKEAAKGA